MTGAGRQAIRLGPTRSWVAARLRFGMLSSVPHSGTSRIYDVRGEYAKGSRGRAFGARHTLSEAEALLAESIRRAEAVGIK